jgi:hypothetical protein
MKLFKSIVVISALCIAVAACQSNSQLKEDMLTSSGFKPTRPTNPTQLASLRSLPPHKLTKTTYKGKTVWVYPDPTICGCLYIGGPAAYAAYSKNQNRQTMLDMTSVTVAPVPGDQEWDFSPWPEAAMEP